MPANSATASGLATRYATALFELAREQDALDRTASDLSRLVAMRDESPEFRRLMTSPIVSRDEQARAVATLAERADISSLVRNFLGVLAQKRRLAALPGIVAAFRAMLAEHKGEATAEVISAVPLDEPQLRALEESVARYAGKAVSLTSSVDPSLLGGLVVRIGSRQIDASLKTKLHQLELSMRGVG